MEVTVLFPIKFNSSKVYRNPANSGAFLLTGSQSMRPKGPEVFLDLPCHMEFPVNPSSLSQRCFSAVQNYQKLPGIYSLSLSVFIKSIQDPNHNHLAQGLGCLALCLPRIVEKKHRQKGSKNRQTTGQRSQNPLDSSCSYWPNC